MEKAELIKKLKALSKNTDIEKAHVDADNLLIEYIDDKAVKKAYENIGKWYA